MHTPLRALIIGLTLFLWPELTSQAAAQPFPPPAQPAAMPSLLQNATLECGEGGYFDAQNSRSEPIRLPNQWTLAATGEIPVLDSTRIFVARRALGDSGGCDTPDSPNVHVERIEGRDSLLVRALDLETPPAPGKPFDVSIWQQVDVVSGTVYSLSSWMLTLCGGSFAEPNDCPSGVYMAKMVGIDPTGGTDPNAATVLWSEDRRNFVGPDGRTRLGWANVRTGARAQSDRLTVFARIRSPFQWHGNHGFIDALSLLQAPTATLTVTSVISQPQELRLRWDGTLGTDVAAIAGGTYQVLLELQYWHDANGVWLDLQPAMAGLGSWPAVGSATFQARCTGSTYRFRIRPRAEQPEGGGGVSPNHRYPGVWSEPATIFVTAPELPPLPPLDGPHFLYLPTVQNGSGC